MQISQYLIVRKYGNPSWPKFSSRLTAGSPALSSNEIAVKLNLILPDAIFDKPAFEAKVVVPDEAVSKPVITADVIDNVEEIIKQNTGFEVKLEIVEQDKEESV
jgi:hypothetical protein